MGTPNWKDILLFNPVGAHSSGLNISSAVTITIPTGATKFMIQAITQNIRITFDGTTPTATLGFSIKTLQPPVVFPLGESTVIKVIQEAATASMQYQFGN